MRETFALCIVCCSKALGLSLVVTSGWQALCAWSAKFPCVIFEVVFVIVAGHQPSACCFLMLGDPTYWAEQRKKFAVSPTAQFLVCWPGASLHLCRTCTCHLAACWMGSCSMAARSLSLVPWRNGGNHSKKCGGAVSRWLRRVMCPKSHDVGRLCRR